MKRTASVATLAAVLLLAPVTVAGTAAAAPYYANCDTAHAAGVSNIRAGEPGYRLALDRNHNGVACEEDGSSNGGSGSGSGSDGNDGATSNPITDDPGSGTSNGSGSSGSSDSTPAQVAVVPQGGTETGDGSTEGHPVWWIAGVLLTSAAGLVGLAAVRRRRMPTRR